MSNKPTYTPSLGEAASSYLPPSQQASEHAKKQLQETLLADGRTTSGKTATLDNLKNNIHIPASYTTNETGAVEYTTTIARQPEQYTHVYETAEHEATRMKLEYQLVDKLTPEQEMLIHALAIQKAINQEIRPDQDQAEKNMHQLTENTLEKGETTTSTAEVKNNKAELCNMKGPIAQEYLQNYAIGLEDVTMVTEAEYKGKQEGHNYLILTVNGKPYSFHPNSPVSGTDLPQIEGLTDEQQQALLELQQKAA